MLSLSGELWRVDFKTSEDNVLCCTKPAGDVSSVIMFMAEHFWS